MNTKQKIQYWVIPPKADAEFAAQMEEVLDVYHRPYNVEHPVICMDEQPVQLLKETRIPIEATRHHPKRVDYEYERAGTASIFMFNEPLSGWRTVKVRQQRKKVDWAIEVAKVLDKHYSKCEQVTLVCDNLNTHTKGAFYEAFPADQARRHVKKINFCFTPKHGSWLNISECELSAMTRQCIFNRRLGTVKKLRKEVKSWAKKTNKKQRNVDWQMQIDDARIKLKSVYPKS
jgi:hypothetical protein